MRRAMFVSVLLAVLPVSMAQPAPPPADAEKFFRSCGDPCDPPNPMEEVAGRRASRPSIGVLFRSTGEFVPAGGMYTIWVDSVGSVGPGNLFVRRTVVSRGEEEYFAQQLLGDEGTVSFTDPQPLPQRRGEEILYTVALATVAGEVLQVGLVATTVEVVGASGRRQFHLNGADLVDGGAVRVTGVFPEHTPLTISVGSPGGPVYWRAQVLSVPAKGSGESVTKVLTVPVTGVGKDVIGRVDVVVEFPNGEHATLPGGLLILPPQRPAAPALQ